MTRIIDEALQVVEARSEGFCILTKSGRVVVGSEDEFGHFGPIKNHDDASRIVACVNACAGIPTDILESSAKNMLELSAARANCAKWAEEAAQAKQQRDDLQAQVDEFLEELTITLGSLKEICSVRQIPRPESTIRRAESVINKITGETK